MHWDWNKTLGGVFRLCIMLLSFSFAYQNQILINNFFLPQIPVGSILLFVFGILILIHIHRVLKWYFACFKTKRYRINVLIHFCLYLSVFSIALSIPTNLDISTATYENVNQYINEMLTQALSSSVISTSTPAPTPIPVPAPNVTESPTPIEISTVSEQPTESPIATESITPDNNNAAEVSGFKTDPKTVDYGYVLRGIHGHIPYTVYGGLNDYLKGLPRSISYYTTPPTDIDFIMRDINDKNQKQLLDPLVEEIQSITPNNDDQARIAISLVQNINYDLAGLTSGNLNNKYPYEVLYTGCGVCSEKSELLAYLLRGLGYEVVRFRFYKEKHVAIGIKCPQQYSYKDTGYCFVESTAPSIITDGSGDYVGVGKLTTTPQILKLCDGNSFDSVSEEYNDAIALNNIGFGKTLDEETYNKWQSLVNKYGMKITNN